MQTVPVHSCILLLYACGPGFMRASALHEASAAAWNRAGAGIHTARYICKTCLNRYSTFRKAAAILSRHCYF
ncbi:hypothetical protein HMPREF3213_01398 [Heyndrickxia coagulans]|uniref:Uncharacterized protein n=1 Tax=Heyndrickxia coagulans TaxID=1398 RepID=A0A133KTF6_HEYCO|nr:hypothetical protein HMPREF3213_01398 [Heyndrickxia coagulans]